MPQKLRRVIRLDSQPLNQTFFTDEGYLMDRPILTSTGIFEYANPDGSIRRELRLPEDVFDPESLKSYRGKPIIVTHDAGLITKDNVADNTVGTILSEGYRSGDDVRAEIVIHDADVLKDCGYRELSLGYNLDLDETPGEYNGEPYDAIQRNIRINHLALVAEARAGEQARLNIDSRDKALKGGKVVKKTKKKVPQRTDGAKRRTDGILTPDELKKAIAEYKARRAERLATKNEDDDTQEVVVPAEEVAEVTIAVVTEPENIEDQVQLVKDRRDRRDEAGDPADLAAAQGVIAEQDKDLSCLFDIIDTLLAQIDFAGDEEETAEEPAAEETAQDEDETTEETAETATEEETAQDGADEDYEAVVTEETAEAAAEDTCLDGEDEEKTEEEIPAVTLNADSIDRIVRERVRIARAADQLNMDGLETIKPMKAKKTIIRAVKPGIRLDGKSAAYVDAMFDLACQELQNRSRKDTSFQRKQMFNKDSRAAKTGNSTESARQKMIQRMQKTK